MLPVLDNFISFGTDVFKSRPDYIQMTVDMYTRCITSEQLGENDRVNGSKLIESLLLNLRGSIDDVGVIFEQNMRVLSVIASTASSDYHQCDSWYLR